MAQPSITEHVRLGRSELRVSPIAFGTWQLGGEWGEFDEQRAIDAIRHARSLGVNLFDTAQAYGFGASERLLARALEDELRSARDEVVVATKGGLRPSDGIERDSSPEWLRQGVEESLEALGVEWIDLYQVHWPDPNTSFADTAAALAELKEEGKIRHVGVSNFSAGQMEELSKTLPVETLQPPFHLFARDIEQSVLPWCRDHDAGVLVYSPLAHGLLTGGIDEDTEFADDDWRSGSPLFAGDALRQNVKVVAGADRNRRSGGLHAEPARDRLGALPPRRARRDRRLAQPRAHRGGRRRPRRRARRRELQWIEAIMQGAVSEAGPSPEMNRET